jgi:dihydrofolate reductase
MTMKITVTNHVSLDGVMQGPGGAGEDTRDGFPFGGWAAEDNDDVMARKMGQAMSGGPGALLFGRRTYELMARSWRGRTDNPFTAVLDKSTKYVASRSLKAPLNWENSVLIDGDVAEAVARLKEEESRDATILGSGELIRTLREADLIDRYVLMIHPVVLGQGRRMFLDGRHSRFTLTESLSSTTGVIIATYERTGD